MQTIDQRTRIEKLKAKRKSALDARLAKVREKRLKKTKGENGEEMGNEMEENIVEKAEVERSHVMKRNFLTSGLREVTDKAPTEACVQKKSELPEWAKHKIRK